MIQLEELTPRVYYDQSRDFQFIGRLYDLVLNSVKTNADLMYYINNTQLIDAQLLNLLALSLGFKVQHNYNARQLRAVCACLVDIMRNKGNIKAIYMACNAILGAEGIDEPIDYTYINGKLTLYIPTYLTDTSLLWDLADYLLPAGSSLAVIKELSEKVTITTEITTSDTIHIYYDKTASDGAQSTNSAAVLSQLNHTASGIGRATDMKAVSNEDLLVDGQLANQIGVLANSTVYKPEPKLESTDLAAPVIPATETNTDNEEEE